MKKLLLVVMAIVPAAVFAQVGIGNTSPKSQLDISASNPAAPTSQDGLLIPRIDAFPAIAPTANQNGMMVFLTTTSAGKAPGFYYWDDATTSWIGIAGAKGWDTVGNSGTNPATNFLGTTDAVDLIFKRHNVQSGRLNPSATSFGVGALNPANSGVYNTAVGASSLTGNTTGHSNTTLGSYAMYTNTDGVRNTALGTNSMYYNQTGEKNTGVGNNALNGNQTGNNNVAVGNDALTTNLTGSNNTAIGNESGNLITGSGNLTIGANTNVNNPAGSHQMNIGQVIYGEGINMTSFAKIGICEPTPKAKLHMGNAANPSMPTNADGIIISRVNNLCAPASMTADQNGMMVFLTTAVGANQPGFYYWDQPSTSWKGVGTNTANAWNLMGNTGYNAGTSFIGSIDSKEVFFRHTNQPSGVIGFADTSFGYRSLGVYSLTARNSAFGALALENNTVSTENSVLGSEALNKNTVGSKNVAVGNRALYKQDFLNAGAAYDSRNTAVGYGALYATNSTSNTNGAGNVGIGYYALANNGSGFSNVAIGQLALGAAGSAGGTMTGDFNIGIGGASLKSNATGSSNIAIGSSNLGYNINGIENIGIGTNALFYSTNLSNGTAIGTRAMQNYGIFATGINDNVALGYEALRGTNTSSNYTKNAAVGYQSMTANVSGDGNAAMGYQSLTGNTSGSNNTAIGRTALGGNTTGSDNVAIGNSALITNRAGSKAIAIGSGAMQNANDSTTAFDNKNIAIGYEALKGSATASNNTGINNIAVGSDALKVTTSGEKNTALGNGALSQNTQGIDNVGIGFLSLETNTNGISNTSIGNYSLEYGNASNNTGIGYYALNHIGGNNNTATGYFAMGAGTMGAGNTAHGAYSLLNATGTYNTAIGFRAGDGNSTGNYNITIGANSDVLNPAADNQMSIANVIYGANMDNLVASPAYLSIGAAPNAKYKWYNFANQITANGDGQYGIYSYRERNSLNHGSGYGVASTNAAIAGTNWWGENYTFGTIGYTYYDFNRCGGVLGSHAAGTIWSSLAYKASNDIGYAVYGTSAMVIGTGRFSQPQAQFSIGGGFYGGVIGSWSKGDIGNISAGKLFAAYNSGDEYTAGRQIELVDTGNSKTAAYTVTSTESVVYKKGKITLVNGSARVTFDASYVGLLGDVPIVTTTPMGPCNGIYIESVDKTGFTVKELNNGASNIAISWIAVGDRIDAGQAANSDVMAQDFDTNLNEVMFNENNKSQSAQGIWSENNRIKFGTIPQTEPEAGQKQ